MEGVVNVVVAYVVATDFWFCALGNDAKLCVAGGSCTAARVQFTLHSAMIAMTLEGVSSVCNYATIGVGHMLREKGVSRSNTLTMMIASTNIGIPMLITVYNLFGTNFLPLMVVAALLFIICCYGFAMLLRLPEPHINDQDSHLPENTQLSLPQACGFFMMMQL